MYSKNEWVRAGFEPGSRHIQIPFKEIFPLIQYLISVELTRTRFETFECNGVKHIKWVFHTPPSGFVIRKRAYIFAHPYNHKKCPDIHIPEHS